jgi:hypothetical protein
MGDTTEVHGEPQQWRHGWHRVPKGWSVCESVWLGLAACCSEVPYIPLGGGTYEFRPWPVE